MDEVIQLRIISILAIMLENTGVVWLPIQLLLNFRAISFLPSPVVMLLSERGVSCLGRLAMTSDNQTVLEEFKPLLLSVASNQDEKLEILAQAMMAICDLPFLFSEMLAISGSDHDEEEVSFVSLLSDLLRTSKPAAVAVAAEIASKLLFAGRTFDVNLLADLIVTYFDQDIASLVADAEDEATEIGSPIRMPQLLSLSFPAYGMRSPKCKAALVSSIGPMLTAVSNKLSKKGAKVADWKMARMVEYAELRYGTIPLHYLWSTPSRLNELAIHLMYVYIFSLVG